MAYLMVAGNTVVYALGQAALPRLARHYTGRDRDAFYALLMKLVGVGALMAAVGVSAALLVGPELLTLLYQPEYGRHRDLFVWLMVAAGAGYIGSLLGCGVTATRAFKRLTFPYLILVAISGLLSRLLIPTFGLLGAAWVACATSLTSCVIPIIILATEQRRESHVPPEESVDRAVCGALCSPQFQHGSARGRATRPEAHAIDLWSSCRRITGRKSRS
jgi:O-antigen/teichoic acid export membrane protein